MAPLNLTIGIGVLARNRGARELYRELGFAEHLIQLKKELRRGAA